LGVQVVDLPVEIAEICRVNAIHVGKRVLESGHLAGEQECAIAVFVVHVLSAFSARLLPGGAEYRAVFGFEPVRLAIVCPVRKCDYHCETVKALVCAKSHVVLEPGVRTERPLPVIVAPSVPECWNGPPSITQKKERRAVGIFEGVAVCGCLNHTAPARILIQFRFAPSCRGECAGLAV